VLTEANARLVAQVAECDRRLVELGQPPVPTSQIDAEAPSSDEPRGRRDRDGGRRGPRGEPTKEDWERMAESATLRVRMPCVRDTPWKPNEATLDRLGLSPDDGETIRAAYAESNKRMLAEVRPLCGKVLGSPDVLDKVGADTCIDAILNAGRRQSPEADVAHLRKVAFFGRLCSVLGWATAWIAPNPVSAALLSTGRFSRWSMIAHHVAHRGYDRVGGPQGKPFAEGWRRLIDWFDWIDPAAWKHEHNTLHHYRLNEDRDPDLVEANLDWMRTSGWPMWVRPPMDSTPLLPKAWTSMAILPSRLASIKPRKATPCRCLRRWLS
jgi:hypothetical protein